MARRHVVHLAGYIAERRVYNVEKTFTFTTNGCLGITCLPCKVRPLDAFRCLEA
jgi:hypothetical protein